jgi:integrase
VTTEAIERWIATVDRSSRTRNKLVVMLHGILGRARKVFGLRGNAAADVEKFSLSRNGDIEVYSPEEVWALRAHSRVRAGRGVYLTAAFTGLRRGELIALRWRDIDFAAQRSSPSELRRRRADNAEERQGPVSADGS